MWTEVQVYHRVNDQQTHKSEQGNKTHLFEFLLDSGNRTE